MAAIYKKILIIRSVDGIFQMGSTEIRLYAILPFKGFYLYGSYNMYEAIWVGLITMSENMIQIFLQYIWYNIIYSTVITK